jgi:probable F420-dependent oxidoreductase
MHVGITVRNMGPQSSVEILTQAVQAADEADLESIWLTDHIAIPPDDAQGSGGRYLDPLITLAYAAAATRRIKLGAGVLILPYRPALPVAKQLATLQELSGGRLLLGVGIGWMDAEFRALGLNRHNRGRAADTTLEFLNRCFENDVVEANGQEFLFLPRPAKPPLLVGGAPPHALRRAVHFADGWLPMGLSPEAIARHMRTYHAMCSDAGKPPGTVTLMRGLPLSEPPAARDLLAEYAAVGVERLVCGVRYDTADEYRAQIAALADLLS